MRRRKISIAAMILGLIVMVAVLAACAPAAPMESGADQAASTEAEEEAAADEGMPKYGGILKFGQAQASTVINPWGGRLHGATE